MANQKFITAARVFIFAMLSAAGCAYAAAGPVLNFSDLINGPKSGLNDGLGEGAIVTVWGNNLGSSQGTSKLYFKDSQNNTHEAAHIYYWKNADGQLPGGPAELYTYHKMQEIAFSIPSAAADGPGSIYVKVNGMDSNELEFTIRSGDIYYAKDSGNDLTGDGSWANPWKTFGYSTGGASTKNSVEAGDIVYGVDVTEIQEVAIRIKDGTIDAPISLIAYPGARLSIKNNATVNIREGGLVPYNITDKPEYWIFSKWDIHAKGSSGIVPFNGGRLIGNAVTDYLDGEGCADGAAGAICTISGTSSAAKIYGNYIHDWGCYETSNQEHTTYFSIRNQGYEGSPMEIAWNSMIDNSARFAIHFYDEHDCWGYSGTTKIHDNYISNQVGPGFNLGTLGCDDGRSLSGNFDVYNNVFVNTGQLGANNAGFSAIHIYGSDTPGHVRVFNNTIYGYGYAGAEENGYDAAINVDSSLGNSGLYYYAGTWEFSNNIVVDTNNLSLYVKTNPILPESAYNNLWYSLASSEPPTWDNNRITADPLFKNTALFDFSIQPNSPAVNAGSSSVSGVVTRGFLGIPRPQGAGYDIGAFEYSDQSYDATPPAAPGGITVK